MCSVGDIMYLLRNVGSMYKGDFWNGLLWNYLKSRLGSKVDFEYTKAQEEVST